MTISQARDKYQDDVDVAVNAELLQMVDYDVFEPVNEPVGDRIPSSFMKDKFVNGKFSKLKARLVAGGHREYVDILTQKICTYC